MFFKKSGTIGHSLANDLMDEFGATDNARDAMAVLYTGMRFES